MNFLELVKIQKAETAARNAHKATRRGTRYMSRLAEAVNLVDRVKKGTLPTWRLQEALTTSDFAILFADVLDRTLLTKYQATASSWPMYAKRSTVPDFRTVKRFFVDGADGILPVVPEATEYPATTISDGQYTYSVLKYGRRLPFSWETIINDDLNALTDIPERFGIGAARSEERFVTTLFCGAAGPDATLYPNPANRVPVRADLGTPVNPPLSIAALNAAITALMAKVDPVTGEPIDVGQVSLVVPPQLAIVAQLIVSAMTVETESNIAAGTVNTNIVSPNFVNRFVPRVAVNHYLPLVNTTNGATSWYLFAGPQSRPALEIGFLRGHESPEVFVKQPNMMIAGGENYLDGDFDTDSIIYKVRHVFGGAAMDPTSTIASDGTGV